MVSVINPKGLSSKILPFCIYYLKEDKENILTGILHTETVVHLIFAEIRA